MSQNGSGFSAIQSQARGLKQRAEGLRSLLEQQQTLLRRRGINLPNEAGKNLLSIHQSIDKLALSLVESQMQMQHLRRLAETSALVNSSQETEEVLKQVVDTVIQLTQAERGYIVLKNRESGELEFKVARGLSAQETAAGGRIVSWSIINRVAESGEPLLTVNASADENISHSESIVDFALLSILAVPLKVRDEIIGVAYCDNRIMAGLFRENELDLLTSFGQQAAVAIENARLFEDIRAQMALIETMQVRLTNIFASISSGIVIVNDENRVMICNTAAQAFIGSAREPLEGTALRAALPAMSESFFDAIEGVRRQRRQEIWAERFEWQGRQRYWQVVASPLRGQHEASRGIALVIEDMTERKEQEEQRRLLGTFVPEALLHKISSIQELDTSPTEQGVTAMFADVRGFTRFSETLQPEDLMRIINRYLGAASDAITAQGGLIVQYLGDSVSALWNTQLNQQSAHSLLAVRAALAIHAAVQALHTVLQDEEKMHFGIGIHSGEAILGMVGGQDRIEYAALGEAPDAGKFLQEHADSGEILISASTYQAVQDEIAAEPVTLPALQPPYEAFQTVYRVHGLLRADNGTSPA